MSDETWGVWPVKKASFFKCILYGQGSYVFFVHVSGILAPMKCLNCPYGCSVVWGIGRGGTCMC